jgi:hypothetical protein
VKLYDKHDLNCLTWHKTIEWFFQFSMTSFVKCPWLCVGGGKEGEIEMKNKVDFT